jgi:hypothetical protein
MTVTLDSPLSSRLGISCVWTVKEKDPKSGLYIPVLRRKNLFTNYGLQALSGALAGTYIAPQYLVIETGHSTLVGSYGAGVNLVTSVARVDQAGDTQILLSPKTANEETMTFSSVTPNGPNFDYHLTANTTKAHTALDNVVRIPRAPDTMAGVVGEAAYDPTNFPGQRLPVVATYSPGAGQTTYQFYYTGIQANVFFALVGLADDIDIGQGNLHNHVALGYDHTIPGGFTSTSDLEIDATLTVVNN